MPEERLGASFSIDVTNLKAGLSTANKLIRESESEFKAAAAGLGDWSESSEGLNAKIKSLNQITDIQRKKVGALQQEYDSLVADGLDPASNAAVDLRTKINNEKAALAKNEAELKKQQKALEELGDEADDASEAIEETGEAAKKSGDGFTVAKGAISGFIANGLTALVGACKNAISSIAGLAEETREYREDMGKLETAWQAAGKSTELATKTYKDFYSVLGEEDRSVEAVNHLAKLVDTEEDMAKWTDIATGVWGTFGDSLPIEGLTEAANETAKVGKLTGVLADALNWAGVNEDDFQASLDKCATEQERQKLITETLNGLYSDAADKYRENNKSVIDARKATSDYTDTMAALGEKIEPITTKVREGFNKILSKILELTEGVDFDALGKKIDDVFQKFIDDYMPKILDGLQWLKDNGGAIAATVAGIGAAMATMAIANKILAVVKAFQAFKVAQEGVTVAQWLLNVAMNANPIGIIVAAVAGLVTAFVLLWKNCEGFRKFWIGLWEGMKKAAKAVADWFVEAWQEVSAFFVELWDGIKGVIDKVVNWIKDNWKTMLLALINPLAGIFKYCYDHFEGFRNFVDNIVSSVKNFFSDLWESISSGAAAAWEWIVNSFHTVIDPWIEIVKRISTIIYDTVIKPITDFFVALWNRLVNGFQKIWNTISGIFVTVAGWFNTNVIQPLVNFFVALWDRLINGFKNIWTAISGVFSTVAGWFNTNVIQPLTNFFSTLWSNFKNGATSAWEGIKSVFSKVADFFGNVFRAAWEKVKKVFSVGGKIFDGIKEGIVTSFKKVVNGIIGGINKVVKIPFEGLNRVLDKIQNVQIVGVKPFNYLSWRAPVPQIPELAKGGVVRGATHAIIGEDGAEAVVPLEKNKQWIKAVAEELAANQKSVVVNQTNNYSQAHSRYEIYKSKQETAAAVRLALGTV